MARRPRASTQALSRTRREPAGAFLLQRVSRGPLPRPFRVGFRLVLQDLLRSQCASVARLEPSRVRNPRARDRKGRIRAPGPMLVSNAKSPGPGRALERKTRLDPSPSRSRRSRRVPCLPVPVPVATRRSLGPRPGSNAAELERDAPSALAGSWGAVLLSFKLNAAHGSASEPRESQ